MLDIPVVHVLRQHTFPLNQSVAVSSHTNSVPPCLRIPYDLLVSGGAPREILNSRGREQLVQSDVNDRGDGKADQEGNVVQPCPADGDNDVVVDVRDEAWHGGRDTACPLFEKW